MKITQDVMIGNVADDLEMTKKDVKKVWLAAFSEVVKHLNSGHEASTPIGIFSTATSPKQPIVRFTLGREMVTNPKTRVRFKASKDANDILNGVK